MVPLKGKTDFGDQITKMIPGRHGVFTYLEKALGEATVVG